MLANPHPHPHPNPDPHPTPNQAELEELQGTITSVEDLLRNEMTRSIVEVVEAEVGELVRVRVGLGQPSPSPEPSP